MSNQKSSSKSVLSNMIWRFLERCGAQGVSFFVTIILARLLMPEHYGTVALVTVFTTILNVFISNGLPIALIQKKDADDLDFSSVFYFNMVLCLVLYSLLFLSAPAIAAFYGMPELTAVVRVLGLTLIISGFKSVQNAYVSRNMLFKRFFFSTLGGTIGAAVVGIYMAYKGYGVWAVVAQSLFNNLVDTVILWFTVKWRPKWAYSWERVRSLFSYGWKLLVSSLLETTYQDLRQLIIGKMYSAKDLAFFNKGKYFPTILVTNLNSSIDSVLLPAMSDAQDDKQRIRAMTRRAVRISSYCMWPMMVGIAVCAEPLVTLLLTEKWLPSVPFLWIYCFSFAFYPIHTANLNAIKAMGESAVYLKIEILKKVIALPILFATMPFGVMAMASSMIVTTIISGFINAFPNKKLLNYSFVDQLIDAMPPILLSAAMGAVVYCVQFLGLSDLLTLMIQVPLGIVIYLAGSVLFKLDSFTYVYGVVKNIIHKGKKG